MDRLSRTSAPRALGERFAASLRRHPTFQGTRLRYPFAGRQDNSRGAAHGGCRRRDRGQGGAQIVLKSVERVRLVVEGAAADCVLHAAGEKYRSDEDE